MAPSCLSPSESNHALAALQGKSMATAWHDVGKRWHDDALAALQGKSMA
jgi:hypothetical protein